MLASILQNDTLEFRDSYKRKSSLVDSSENFRIALIPNFSPPHLS
jgi:hypothetical protein